MFKAIRDWYISQKEEKAKRAKKERDRDKEWEEREAERAVVVPPELLQKFIDANPEYMQDRKVPLYWHTGEFWFNQINTGNHKSNLEDYIKGLIYRNLKRGIPYDKIISDMNDPNFKMNPEPESKEDK